MLEKAHFKAAGLSDQEFEAHFGGGVLTSLQGLLHKVQALGPAGAALAQKTVTDVTSGNWIAVVGDVLALHKMLQATPVPTA